jgi:hypothetical protein
VDATEHRGLDLRQRAGAGGEIDEQQVVGEVEDR